MKLRTGAILALGLALVASPGYAQSVTGGAKVGVNFSKLASGDSEGDSDNKTGALFGGFIDAAVTPQFSVQPEFLYVMGGGKDKTTTPEASINIDQVQIPVLAKFKFASKSQTKPFVYAGPGFGFVTRAKFDDGTNSVDVKDDVEKFNSSFIFGGGVDISNFLIDVRYDLGLRDLDKDTGSEAKLRAFSINVGYSFGKKK
jgi:opacity protein-like surface antigen